MKANKLCEDKLKHLKIVIHDYTFITKTSFQLKIVADGVLCFGAKRQPPLSANGGEQDIECAGCRVIAPRLRFLTTSKYEVVVTDVLL